MKNKKFISIIWGYHKQIYSFEKEQNYHMMPLEIMQKKGYICEIFSIASQVRIENDPNFIQDVNVVYYRNIFQYLYYLWINRKNIIYSNSLTIKTLFVGVVAKNTVFMAHDQVLPIVRKRCKRGVVKFFLKYFTKIRCINSGEKQLLEENNIYTGHILPLAVSGSFFNDNIKSDENVGFFVGNLYHDKNPELLLEVIRKLKKKRIEIIIYIAGEDRYSKNGKSFNNLIQDENLEDNIKILGFIPHKDLTQQLRKSHFFINTSISEGQCLTVYEAALAGNILCLQDIVSFPSVFKDNALYHKTSYELAENIEYILSHKNTMQEKIIKNQKMILNDYNYRKISKQIENMFICLDV